jgi:hypothetical protein
MPVLKTIILGTWLAGGALGALSGGLHSGFDGAVIGFGVGLVGRSLFVRGMLWFINFQQRKGPDFPPCANGVCSRKDYTVTRGGPTGVLYICLCGGEYVLESAGLLRGTYFYRVMDGGALQPYMVRPLFSYWQRIEQGRAQSV